MLCIEKACIGLAYIYTRYGPALFAECLETRETLALNLNSIHTAANHVDDVGAETQARAVQIQFILALNFTRTAVTVAS